MLRLIAGFIMIIVAGYIGILISGAVLWNQKTSTLVDELNHTRKAVLPSRYSESDIASLPAPVQRYFKFALKDGQPVISHLRIWHRGRFRTGLTSERWVAFSSSQQIVCEPAGFVWSGQIMMAPGVPVYVHDAYVAPDGILNPSVFGLFSLAAQRSSGDLAKWELMRYLAETAWYPTALLPGQGVTWTAIDDQSALATLTQGHTTVSLTFYFAETGEISRVYAGARGFNDGKTETLMPWQGRWFQYERMNGIMVPARGEVSWITPGGERPYWRGTIRKISVDEAAQPETGAE